MICRRVTYFTDSAMIEYYQKTCCWNSKSTKNKNYVRNYARCTTLKNHFLQFMLGHTTAMRISKYTTRKWFLSLTTFCKLLHPCYCFIYWGIPNNILLFLAEQISLSLMSFYYVQDVYQKKLSGPRLDKRQTWSQESP